jgi:hypothetical protein
VHTTLNASDRKQIKDDGLKISKVEEVPGAPGEFFIYIERPYFLSGRQNTEIVENTFVNLHTQKSISFTKGMVIKKHLITKESPITEESKNKNDDDEDGDDDSTNLLDNDPAKTEKKKRRERVYLEYIIQF